MATTRTLPLPSTRAAARTIVPADAAAVFALILLTALADWRLLAGGTTIGQDSAVFFYPMYSFLGERLAAGDIPGWNPHQFSGVPFAADPQSGWMYWPAMLLFTFLPLEAAAEGYMLLHLLGAGVATYALARVLGMNSIGALVAAVAYEFSSYMYGRHPCCFSYAGVIAWLPLMILGAEMAIRSRGWITRTLWWGVAGVALSQVLAAWLGQGSYYALLVLGGYTAYRTLLSPPSHLRGARARVVALFLNGGGLLLFGFGLAAAGLVPRLEYNALSNLAAGYEGRPGAVYGGWRREDWRFLLEYGLWYMGGATVVLSAVAPIAARVQFATPYWLVLSIGVLVLSGQGPSPLHSALYLLPGFEQLHPHNPERIMMVFYLGPALLAGATVTRLWEDRSKNIPVALAASGAVVLWIIWRLDAAALVEVPRRTWMFLGLTVALLAVASLLPSARRATAGLLVLVLFFDLLAAGPTAIAGGPGGVKKVDLDSYYNPRGAGGALLARNETEQFRYFGYEPRIRFRDMLYRWQFTDPGVIALEVNNRATLLGLHDTQGYNPVHLARYDEYMRALNRQKQEYRGSYVLEKGVDSPLLHLLNARYAIVPGTTPSNRPDLQALHDRLSLVYENSQVKLLENQRAFPRVWVVHQAQQVEKGEALDLLATGKVDARQTALLEQAPPELGVPPDPTAESARIRQYEPDRIQLEATVSAPVLLVLSEMYYPAWKAYVDGKRTPVLVANHVLRAVPLRPGVHSIELRYESAALTVGLGVSLFFYAVLVGLLLVSLNRWNRRRRTPENES